MTNGMLNPKDHLTPFSKRYTGTTTITVIMDGIGRTVRVNKADIYSRVVPALRNYNVISDWEDADGNWWPPTDQQIMQGWADAIINDLNRFVQIREELQNVPKPLLK